MKAVLLRFTSPLHVGKDSIDSAEIPVHSDTLFGAIASVLPRLGLDPLDLVDGFLRGSRISSLYPFKGDTYYLPKPVGSRSLLRNIIQSSTRGYRMAKRYKKAKFLPKEAFEMAISGEAEGDELVELLLESLPYRVSDVVKVAIDRVTASSNIYYLTQVAFEEDAGLYFLYDGEDELFKDYVLPALRYLGDEGLGGRRSWGLGLFEVETKEFTLREPPDGDLYLTLSLTLPKNPSVVEHWEPVKRSGWIHTVRGKPRRKPTMLFAKEGSIFRERDSGSMLDLDDYGNYSAEVGHKVYVYGKSFPVAMRVVENGA